MPNTATLQFVIYLKDSLFLINFIKCIPQRMNIPERKKNHS